MVSLRRPVRHRVVAFLAAGLMGASAGYASVVDASEARERPVMDRTGMTGRFDIDLRSAPMRVGAVPPPRSRKCHLFTALQEQLGLKLEKTAALIPVLVIDHIEMPTDNRAEWRTHERLSDPVSRASSSGP